MLLGRKPRAVHHRLFATLSSIVHVRIGWGVPDVVIGACCARLCPHSWCDRLVGYSFDTTRLLIEDRPAINAMWQACEDACWAYVGGLTPVNIVVCLPCLGTSTCVHCLIAVRVSPRTLWFRSGRSHGSGVSNVLRQGGVRCLSLPGVHSQRQEALLLAGQNRAPHDSLRVLGLRIGGVTSWLV